ncbi:serine carboxypeptidase-like 13 [Lactuca sativa]|uniref:Peptidase S10, serine carboxypeptidase, Alpha/Beta hydrolase fold protein n=1 Tax=Lactuca sativa TaxID=4236 RepID=A0A9R1XTF8_LACSA|nr:serine carboxypeptidase-like 13 [Lactuca sativa]KAJ0221029.1 hypothetical protein LSAT_V11C200056390 [Lactuca sativa]
MESGHNSLMFSFVFVFIFQAYLLIICHSKSVVKALPGYTGDLPFKLETGYVGVGENEDVQLFYLFAESTRNPEVDPLIFYIPGGPGTSSLYTFLYEIGSLQFDLDNSQDNITLVSNPNTWTQMANLIIVDIPAGTGFSYAETKDGWISSDTILSIQANEFIKKFLLDHPMFLKNPLYIGGISYTGMLVPKIALEIYEGNERGDQPTLNIQGYIVISPLTDKFKDFNSRFEYAHRMALISDDIYKSAVNNCYGNYVNIDRTNTLCANSLDQYEQCIMRLNFDNILEPFCDENDPEQHCESKFNMVAESWANSEAVQRALNVRQGKIGKWEMRNDTIHYSQGKNDTFCYSYDIFSSFGYHEKLGSKHCQCFIMSGDHDMTFPYVGVEEWISSLNIAVEIPWKPFYVDSQVGGYEMKYAKNDHYSLTFATVKGAGHMVPYYKPKESTAVIDRWFSSQTYSSDY